MATRTKGTFCERRAIVLILAVWGLSGDGSAWAQSTAIAGAVGAGSFDESASAVLELGVDVAGDNFAVGLGARLRLIEGEGLRERDWDDRSEYARILRYAVWSHRPEQGVGASLAAGELGGVTLGRGAVFRDYGTGVLADIRRLGLQLRTGAESWQLEAVVDDVVAPRIFGARAERRVGPFGLSLVGALDRNLPDGDNHDPLGIVSVEALWGWSMFSDRLQPTVFVGATGIPGDGAGAHIGASATVSWDGGAWEQSAEVFVQSPRYVHGWFGPLYEVERMQRRAVLDGAMGRGVGTSLGGTLTLWDTRLLRVMHMRRPGLPNLALAQVLAPEWDPLQLGAWVSTTTTRGQDRIWSMAAEGRLLVGDHMFVRAEVARLFTDVGGVLSPMWSVLGTVGASVGDIR